MPEVREFILLYNKRDPNVRAVLVASTRCEVMSTGTQTGLRPVRVMAQLEEFKFISTCTKTHITRKTQF